MPDYQQLRPSDLSQETYWLKEKLWFDNIAQNLPAVRQGKNSLLLKGTCAGPCVVVGAGPSVEKFGLIGQLKGVNVHVVSSDRALEGLLSEGIVPEYVVSADGDPKIAEFYKAELVRRHGSRMSVLLANQVHPSVVKLAYETFRDVYWFGVLFDDPGQKRSISRVLYWMTNETTMAMAYGNVGAFCWSFADFLGHKTVILVGLDFSYGEGAQPMQTTFWKGFLERSGGKVQDALKFYRWDSNPWGRKVLTDALWDGYREIMQKGIETSQVRTVNVSPLSIIHGPKVSTMSLDQALQKYTLRL